MTKLTLEEHKKRHVELHKMLDELIADWLNHEMTYESGKSLSDTTILELMTWSHEQTTNPKELKEK